MTKLIIDCETTGLSPVIKITDAVGHISREHRRLLCISILNIETGVISSFYGENEKQFLIDFFEFLDNRKPVSEIIGFNSQFDINFIKVRSFFHSIKISPQFLFAKKTDLRKAISEDKYAVGTLKFWAETFGAKSITEDGSKMSEMYEKGDWDSIREHSEEDVKLTQLLFNKCAECNLIK